MNGRAEITGWDGLSALDYGGDVKTWGGLPQAGMALGLCPAATNCRTFKQTLISIPGISR